MKNLIRKLRDIKYYILHRWVWKSHIINLKHLRGYFQEVDTMLFESIMKIFNDYVMYQKTHTLEFIEEQDDDISLYPAYEKLQKMSLFRKIYAVFFDEDFKIQMAIDSLDWEIKWLKKETEQNSINSKQLEKEILTRKIFIWYNIIRKERKDPFYSLVEKQYIDKNGNITDKAIDECGFLNKMASNTKSMFLKSMELEELYDFEDEEMMMQIIKNRHHFWT